LHVGLPQSKEAMIGWAHIDAILLATELKKGDELLNGIDDEHEGRPTDARLVGCWSESNLRKQKSLFARMRPRAD
jgi:hypothetical protein